MLAEGCKDYFSEYFIFELLSLSDPARKEKEKKKS